MPHSSNLLLFLEALKYHGGGASSVSIEYFLGGQMTEDLSLIQCAWKTYWTQPDKKRLQSEYFLFCKMEKVIPAISTSLSLRRLCT